MRSKSKTEITFHIYTLGCKLNQAEEKQMAENLINAGYKYVPPGKHPDIFIVNSCTVTNRARYKSLSTLRRIKSKNPHTRIVLAGCIPQTESEIGNMDFIDLVIENNQKPNIAEHIKSLNLIPDIVPDNIIQYKKRSRASLIIQTGCSSSCSYCIIPHARGPSRSFSKSLIFEDLDRLLSQGYKEIVLTGIHISHYTDNRISGRTIEPLENLIAKILSRSDDFRLRLSSIEPAHIDERFIDFMLSNDRICPHLHIPLQHTSDRILKLMNRNYTNQYIYKLIDMIYRKSENLQIGSDFIIGFPSEDEDDFSNLCSTVKDLFISHFHIFPFSKRKNTLAYNFTQQVEKSIKKERSSILHNIADQKKKAFLVSQLKKTQDLIILSRLDDRHYSVVSANYISGILRTCQYLEEGSMITAVAEELAGDTAVFTSIQRDLHPENKLFYI